MDDSFCPIYTSDSYDLSDLLKKNCDFKKTCGIYKELYYDKLNFDFDLLNLEKELVVAYYCEKDQTTAKELWNAFNS